MGTTGADRAARSAADSVDGVGVVSTGLRGGDRVGPSRERGEKKKAKEAAWQYISCPMDDLIDIISQSLLCYLLI